MRIVEGFCILFSGISLIMDVKWEKVYNYWIIAGILCSLLICFGSGGTGGIVKWVLGAATPLAVLFPLFIGKMLGTGDIKVFAVLGSAMGSRWVFLCMAGAFLIGAVIAVPVLLFRCNIKERFIYFFNYLNHVLMTKTFPPYLAPGKNPENIHFTIPIFCSVLLMIMRGGTV